VQKWIKENILDKLELSASAKGFVKGRSICDNANVHISSDLVLNVDLYRFFDSITERRIYGLFRWMGYQKNLARDFSKLLCYKPSTSYWSEVKKEGIFSEDFVNSEQRILPQGSPASPAISNLICYSMDKRFEGVANALGLNYSRYADDLTFSGSRKSMISLRLVKQICKDEGFWVNESKTKYLSKSSRQLVTGLVVNAGVRVPSNLKREINKHLFFAKTKGVKNHLDWTTKNGIHRHKANFREYLLGHIYFVKSIEREVGERMLEQFKLIEWEL
jgi:RNA-directed DNA polymerase